MFKGIHRALIAASFGALLVANAACSSDGAPDGTGTEFSNSGVPSEATQANASGSSSSSSGGAPGAGVSGAPAGEGQNGSSGSAAQDSDAGGIAPVPVEPDAGVIVSPVPVAPKCVSCADFAVDQLGPSKVPADQVCSGGKADSFNLYIDLLGCMCSGPCADECGDTACALIPTAASKACVSCVQLSNAACGSAKTACSDDK